MLSIDVSARPDIDATAAHPWLEVRAGEEVAASYRNLSRGESTDSRRGSGDSNADSLRGSYVAFRSFDAEGDDDAEPLEEPMMRDHP